MTFCTMKESAVCTHCIPPHEPYSHPHPASQSSGSSQSTGAPSAVQQLYPTSHLFHNGSVCICQFPIHPPPFPHCVHMPVLYVCISIPALQMGSPAITWKIHGRRNTSVTVHGVTEVGSWLKGLSNSSTISRFYIYICINFNFTLYSDFTIFSFKKQLFFFFVGKEYECILHKYIYICG